jgi:hypothetical protein
VEVDPELEITEIASRIMAYREPDKAGPALLFERVKGSPYPLYFNFAQWKYSYSLPITTVITTPPYYSTTYKDYEFVWNNIGFGARGMYHFNFLKNLDTYAGLTLGYVIQTFIWWGLFRKRV